jgi:hypothetical protein
MTVQYVIKDPKDARNLMLFDHEPGMRYAVVVDKFVRGWSVWDLYQTEAEARAVKPYWDVSINGDSERKEYSEDEVRVIKIYGVVSPLPPQTPDDLMAYIERTKGKNGKIDLTELTGVVGVSPKVWLNYVKQRREYQPVLDRVIDNLN